MFGDLVLTGDVLADLELIDVRFQDARTEVLERCRQNPKLDWVDEAIWQLRQDTDLEYLPSVARSDHRKDSKQAGSRVTIFPGAEIPGIGRIDFIRLGGMLSKKPITIYKYHEHKEATVNYGLAGEYYLWQSDPLARRRVLKTKGLVSGWRLLREGDMVPIGSHEHHAALVRSGSSEFDTVIAILQGGSVLHGAQDGKIDVVKAKAPYKGYFKGYKRGPHGNGLVLPGGPSS